MLNSLLMLGSTNKKMKKANYIFAIIWIGYMLCNSNLKTGLFFTIANLLTFMIVFALGKVIKGKYSNMVTSILSILIWSVIIDIICFFMYPQFTMGQTLIGYIGNGILFNYKYVFTNILAVSAISLAETCVKKVKHTNFTMQKTVTSV